MIDNRSIGDHKKKLVVQSFRLKKSFLIIFFSDSYRPTTGPLFFNLYIIRFKKTKPARISYFFVIFIFFIR